MRYMAHMDYQLPTQEYLFPDLLKRVDALKDSAGLAPQTIEREAGINKSTILYLRRGKGATYSTIYRLWSYIYIQEARIEREKEKANGTS